MRILFIPMALLTIYVIFMAIKKGQVSLNDSFFWMTAGCIMLILGIFPKMLDRMAIFFGISYPPSLIFLISIMFLLYLCFRMIKQIHVLNLRVIELGQQMALLKEKMESDKVKRSDKR